jgi:hypothetical protein
VWPALALALASAAAGSAELKHEGGEGGRKGGMCGDVCAPKPFKRGALDTFLLRNLLDTGGTRGALMRCAA